MILDELKLLVSDKTLVTIEREDVSSDQITGVIVKFNEEFVLMCLHDDAGKFDGFSIFATSQISEILWGNREHECIAEFMKNETTQPDPEIDLSTMPDILVQLGKKYPAVSLMEDGDESSFDVAEIVKVDEKWVKLHCYGTLKTLSRLKKIVSVDTFSRIEFDSPYVKRILNLHKNLS